jgi:predicted amidohydrolase YtcJ
MKRVFWVTVTVFMLSGCGDDGGSISEAGISTDTVKTTIYTASDIVTMDPSRPFAEAVAVFEQKIIAVGSLEEVTAEVDGAAYKVDRRFDNHVIVPGLIDQHVHPLLAALSLNMEVIAIENWVLPDRTSKAVSNRSDYLQRLKAAEAGMEDVDETLFTWGFHHYFHGKLTRQDLDSISAIRPIVVWHRSAHEFILNTPAMERYGITDEFYDSFSESERSQSNFAEGHFWEQGWYPVLYKLVPALTDPVKLRSNLEFVERYLHEAGVTLIAEPGGLVSKELQNAQNAVLGDADTPFRSYFIVDGKTMASTQLNDLIAATEVPLEWGAGKTSFLPKQAKLFADGAIFSQAMQMIDGYTDGHHGEWMMAPSLFADAFNTYWDAGYQLHIHQNGDAGLEMVLDLLEEAQRRNPRDDHRTTIVHFGFSTAEQVGRIAALGAIVSANPYYLTALADNYAENGLGAERANEMVRLGDVLRAGVSLSLHSDMAMAPAQPLYLMWSAVNRETVSGRVAGPEQRIGVRDALKAVTLGAAYSLRLEESVGSLEPGKLANMTILEKSPYDVEPDYIKDINIWGTVHEGRLFPIER